MQSFGFIIGVPSSLRFFLNHNICQCHINSKFVTTGITPTRPWYEIVGLVGVSVWSWVSCGWQEHVLAKNLSEMQENLISKNAQEGHKINQGSTLVVSDTFSAKLTVLSPTI
jgi:hypothetical protein